MPLLGPLPKSLKDLSKGVVPGWGLIWDSAGEGSASKLTYMAVGRPCFLLSCVTRIKVKFLACPWPGAHLTSLPCGHGQHQSQHERESDKKMDVIISAVQSPNTSPRLYHILPGWFDGVVQSSLKERESHKSVAIRRQGLLRIILEAAYKNHIFVRNVLCALLVTKLYIKVMSSSCSTETGYLELSLQA